MKMRSTIFPRSWAAAELAMKKFSEIDGTQRAAAFAFYTLFSLFPLIPLFVTVGSHFFEREVAVRSVIDYVQAYLPLGPQMQGNVFDSINGVIETRGQVGAAATVALLWGTLKIFTALVRATNRAWNTETHNWWQMPLKNLALVGVLGGAVVLGLAVPAAAKLAGHWLPSLHGAVAFLVTLAITATPVLVLFYGIALFYRLAPRRRTRFSEVWPAALGVALLLWLLQGLFALYLKSFGNFNVVYGALGGLMALLMWIYLSGCIIVFGACLTSAQAEMRSPK